MVTCPKAYHGGFSHGYNVSEAVNIATPGWLKYAFTSQDDYSRDRNMKQLSYPPEWLLVENVRMINYIEMNDEGKKIVNLTY
jgi:hypothetical protein